MRKHLLVTLADANFIDQAKQLFSSVYFNAGWTGDYMLLYSGISQSELEWFREKGILVYEFEPLHTAGPKRWPSTVSGKYYVFTPYFKKWDRVVFLDADIIVRGSIEKLSRVKKFTAIGETGLLTIEEQIVKRDLNPSVNGVLEKLEKEYNLSQRAFNSGVFAFPSSIIQEDSFERILDIASQYNPVTEYTDQVILNLMFYKSWAALGINYNLPVHIAGFLSHIPAREMRGKILHFAGLYKPWHKGSPFFAQWQSNFEKAERIDLDIRPLARESVLEDSKDFVFHLFLKAKLLYWRIRLYYIKLQVVKKSKEG